MNSELPRYDHSKIEKKWQKYWESKKVFQAKDGSKNDSRNKKFYSLIEFPYPSGDGLHVGHIRSNTAMDVISHKRRMEGHNVLYPIGWDAFGLPTENYAIKTGIQPAVVTKKNTDTFRRQLKALGFSFDWTKEINTTDPKYYKWTQWIFLQFLKNGLAYKKKMFINWCPKDLIGLANEEVVDGRCERCGTLVEKKEKEQWMLAITKYADRLDKDLDDVDFLPQIKTQQRNWIGKSEGAEIGFKITFKGGQKPGLIPVFTTRPDTLYGVTYMVLSPEHLWVTLATDDNHKGVLENVEEVKKYIAEVKKKTDIERTDVEKEKTGIELKGVKAVNPATGEEIPLWIADYVLADYGTGAVMAVPAHDERDYAFAKKYGLPIKNILEPLVRKTTGDDAFRIDMSISERNAAVCVIKHWSEDKYLGVRWKKTGWQAFVVGGIEPGEDAKTAALREAREETGYQNFEFERELGCIVHAQFYQLIKKENRFAHFHPVVLKLKDGAHIEPAEEEKALHEFHWLSPKEFDSFITHPDMKIIWERVKGNDVYTGEGILLNSDKFNGKNSEEIKKEITEFAHGKWVTKYKLRDWIFSRQRYWGEPIPVVHCDKCGIVPVPEKDLPVKLPKVKNYKPTETGESPLAAISKWVNTKCPKCKSPAKRETDTMPNWAGSSWYYLRYVDPKNNKAFADANKLKYWTPVDWYNGGMEHTTLHLLYSRFWHKFLFDEGLVPTKEPYAKRTSHGLILAGKGEKMSKSKGNVVNPDDIIKTVGADALRLYEMFMGPFDQAIVWDENGIVGTRRFLEKVWKLQEKVLLLPHPHPLGDSRSPFVAEPVGRLLSPVDTTFHLQNLVHKTIKKVSDDIEEMKFNTAVSSMMILVNEMEKMEQISKEDFEILLKLLAPFAPHMSQELWQKMGNKDSIHLSKWPIYDSAKVVEESARIMVQINGKTRANFTVKQDENDDNIKNMALNTPEIKKWLERKEPKKFIIIKNKLINIVL